MTSKVTCSHGYGQLHWLSLWTSLYKSFTEKERTTGKCINYQDLHLFFSNLDSNINYPFLWRNTPRTGSGNKQYDFLLKKKITFCSNYYKTNCLKTKFYICLIIMFIHVYNIKTRFFSLQNYHHNPGSFSPQHPLPYIEQRYISRTLLSFNLINNGIIKLLKCGSLVF